MEHVFVVLPGHTEVRCQNCGKEQGKPRTGDVCYGPGGKAPEDPLDLSTVEPE